MAPRAGLILSGNTLYGTAETGGASDDGTVFAVNTDGTGFRTLHNFRFVYGSEGVNPLAGLVLAGNTLYGTTFQGGYSYGTVFMVNTDGTAFGNPHSFNVFSNDGNNTPTGDGGAPYAGLILSGNKIGRASCRER